MLALQLYFAPDKAVSAFKLRHPYSFKVQDEPRMNMSILNNAVVSIQLGIDDYQAAKESEARVLSAIRNLTAGLILLFKCKLQELSPAGTDEVLLKSKIKPNINPDGQLIWKGKGAKTVDVDEIIERLEALGIEGIDWSRLRALRDIRNEIEHYYSQRPLSRIMEAMASSFYLIQQFVPKYLGLNPPELLGKHYWAYLVDQEAFFQEEMKQCQENLHKVQWPADDLIHAIPEMCCLECGSPLVKADNPNAQLLDISISCTKCGFSTIYEEFVESTLSEYFAGELYQAARYKIADPLLECGFCERLTFIPSDDRCAACLEVPRRNICKTCGDSLDPEGDGTCSFCDWESRIVY